MYYSQLLILSTTGYSNGALITLRDGKLRYGVVQTLVEVLMATRGKAEIEGQFSQILKYVLLTTMLHIPCGKSEGLIAL